MATATKPARAAKAKDNGRHTEPAAMASSLVMVPRTKLKVRDGFNPRTKIDDVELDGLAQSIVSRGLLTPLLVASTTSGYELVAGHRRIAAIDRAIAQGLLPKDIALPAFLRDRANELEDAVAENFNRVDLNPLEEAQAFERLRKGGLTAKGIAEAVGVAQRRVTERLRILECPKSTWEAFATGKLSVQVAKEMADLTKFDRRLAELTAKAMQGEHRSWGGDVARAAAYAAQYGDGKKGDLRVLSTHAGRRAYVTADQLGAVKHDVADKLNALARDRDATQGYRSGSSYAVGLDQAAIDTLRAAGVLLEVKGSYGSEYICRDMEALKAVVEPIIDREHKEALKREANRQRAAAKGGDAAAAKEDEKAKEYALTVASRAYNLKLGEVLFKNFATVEITPEVVKFLTLAPSLTASTSYYDGGMGVRADLFQAGLRLIDPRYQDEKIVKSTGRTKVTYWSTKSGSQDCVKAFTDWWELATTAQEIAGRTVIAFAAAVYARQTAVPSSQRSNYYGIRDDAKQALAAIVAKKIPKWESPDPAERARDEAGQLSVLEQEVLEVVAADGHSIGGSESTMLESIVEAIDVDVQGERRSKTAVRDALRSLKQRELLDGVLAGGIGITAHGVRIARALGMRDADLGARAKKRAKADSSESGKEGAADEAAPDPVYVDPELLDENEVIQEEARALRDRQAAGMRIGADVGRLIRQRPGITIPELADELQSKQNLLYRILPRLEQAGIVRKEGRGWHPMGVDEKRAAQTELTDLQVTVLRWFLAGGVASQLRSEADYRKAFGVASGNAGQAIAALTQKGLLANGEGKLAHPTKQATAVIAAIDARGTEQLVPA